MAAKQLMPNQCTPLHFIYGPSDCCLCGARAEVERLKTELTTTKRDLAEKVLAAISGLRIDDRFSPHWRNGFGQCKGDALQELQRVFTESGIEVERGDDG